MRMRFKPYAHDELMAADFHVHEPLIWGGKWHSQYARPEQPFVLELGCGKGGFISQLASAHPENNYLGIDITDKVLILAKRKIEAAYAEAGRPIDNVKIMSTDIERINRAECVVDLTDCTSTIYRTYNLVFYDEDNNVIKNKLLMYADGKVADPYGFILVKKGAAA